MKQNKEDDVILGQNGNDTSESIYIPFIYKPRLSTLCLQVASDCIAGYIGLPR